MRNYYPYIAVALALVLIISLYVFGKTTAPKNNFSTGSSTNSSAATSSNSVVAINYTAYHKQALDKLPLGTRTYITNATAVADTQQLPKKIAYYNTLANLWKDSAQNNTLYAYYRAQALKLDNSEKNRTFAAQLLVDAMRSEQGDSVVNWLANEAIVLFNEVLSENPNSVDAKIGIGSAYIYSSGKSGNATETMKGIQQVLSVVQQDSTNMRAQMLLGVGGLVSGQASKAVARLEKVVKAEPQNAEAVAYLADAYAMVQDTANAIKYYQLSKRMVNNSHYSSEVDARIKQLTNK